MTINYRPEIDGLRALALLPVIFFHAGFKFFGGGFVGVDIFFVISGYLITSIILLEKKNNTFSLGRFYERRARRILPALLLVMVACIPFAWLTMLPYDMWSFSKSIGYTLASISNILFYQQNGYFAVSSQLKPLIHTWSLAIEEQYYWLFPLLLMFIWQISKKYMFYIFFIIALTSFIYGEYVLSYKNPDSAFYLIPGRLWELLVGSLIAIYLFHHQKRFDLFIKRFPFASELLGLIGLGFIIYAVLFFDDAMLFPGLNAAMPILGATLIILFARPGFLTTRILTLKPFVWIGLISYSAYLWHQPLMAFTRNISINEPSIFLFLTLAFLSLILGYLSWRYVETPFRSYKAISRRYFFLTIGLLSSLLVIFAYIGFKNEGYPYRVHSYNNPHFQKDNSLSLFETMKLYIGTKPNHAPKNDQQKPKEINVPDIFLNDPNIEINYFGDLTSHDIYVLYGDSHAGVFEESLDQPFKKFKIKGMRIKINHCHPVPEVINAKHNSDMMRSYQTCKASFGNLIQFVKDGAKGVILSSRWTIKLYPLDQINEKQPFDNGEGGVELDWRPEKFMVLDSKHHFTFDRKNKAEVLKDFIYRFDETGKPILLIYPIPEVGWNIPRINFQNYILGRDKLTRDISTSYERFKSRNAFVNNVFDGLNLRHVIRIKPENILCNSFIKDRCVAQMNGVMFYSDDDHLSLEGAKLVSDDMIKKYHF